MTPPPPPPPARPTLNPRPDPPSKPAPAPAPKPTATLGADRRKPWEQVALGAFILVPFLALVAAVPVAWGWGLGWRDVAIAFVMYVISGHGVTVGFHRYFTHGSFRANRALRVGLAIAGSLS